MRNATQEFSGTERFVIERQLGAGSMGAVYLAYDKVLASRVALKVLLSVDAAGIYRFKKEFRALADVAHRNLVTLHELFSEGDRWFFTMEYVQGKDLLTYLHGSRRRAYDSAPRALGEPGDGEDGSGAIEPPVRGLELLFPSPLESEEKLRAVLVQVVEGLRAVHAAGKLHRDLKPENVIVTGDGRAVLLDFGIAFEQQKDIHETLATIVGTPAYMAPEQCRGKNLSEASDLYALGVILYEALTGDVPFDGTPMQVISRKQEVDPVPPKDIVSGVPSDLNELCMQLLQRDPAKRPNGEAILRALQQRKAASMPAPSGTGAQPAPSPFVGREAQLRELSAALDLTESGRPVAVVVHGPSGIGKTTLVQHFVDQVVTEERAIVLKGRCYERESVPFKAFDNVVDSLSRYLRRLPAVESARVLPRDIEALAAVFPVLKRVEVVRRDRRVRPLPPDPSELRQRAFRALKEMFTRITDIEPLIIYVDDLQWSDLDSAKLLVELITGEERPAMMLIAVYRPDTGAESDGLHLFLDQLRTHRDLTKRELAVSVLGPEDSFALARDLLGSDATDDGTRRVGFESGGNPQLLTQMVRHVQERRASGKASPETARGLITFERVLEQRLASLSNDARTLLQLLSVAGRPVPEAMLNLVASFNVDLTTALAELRGAKLVRGVANHAGRAVEVYHDTIRDAITAALPVDALVGWHRRLAAALEASGAVDLEALTDHLLGAGERERASLYAARAAEQAERALAFDKSARLFGVAAENAIQPAQRAEMLAAWANALVAAGRGADAAQAYERAASEAGEAEATELRALAGVQLLMSGELEQGLTMLRAPLAALGVPLDTSAQAALQSASLMWRQQRKRGFAFTERAETDVDPAALRRLDLLLGVTRGLLLHEVDRPIGLVVRLLREALEVGEPSRIVTALATFHLHVDAPFSMLENVPPAGALDVAEALARRLDRIEGRATISLTKGLMVYLNGRVEHALPELRRAEDLLRNHCRGAFYEMRICRQALAHLQLGVRREVDMPSLREWLREAENRGDKITALRFRLHLGTPLLQGDDADGALAQVEEVLEQAGHPASGINHALGLFTRAQALLYKGDADGCRAMYYLTDEVLNSALGAVPVWRGLALLWRARLALIARASGGGSRTMLDAAGEALDAAAALGMPCLAHDVRLVRASLLAAQGKPQAACEPLREIVAEPHDAREPSLHVSFANRALGQLQGGPAGAALVEATETKLRARGIVQPRRYARLFAPGIEELSRRPG